MVIISWKILPNLAIKKVLALGWKAEFWLVRGRVYYIYLYIYQVLTKACTGNQVGICFISLPKCNINQYEAARVPALYTRPTFVANTEQQQLLQEFLWHF